MLFAGCCVVCTTDLNKCFDKVYLVMCSEDILGVSSFTVISMVIIKTRESKCKK